ncbi:DUF3060 domain-containing protein [Mycolicibacter minnesotensis]
MATAIALIAPALAGCTSDPPSRSGDLAHRFDGWFTDTISYRSFGTTSAVDCADGKSLNVAGSNNKLTVRGRCVEVQVHGADNRITIERVDKALTITGLNNSVSYRDGRPKVDDRGSGNNVAGGR